MKYKRLILLLSFLIIFVIYIVFPLVNENGATNSFKKDIIRFHIRANSDEEGDQELKLRVRDRVLETMGEKFKETSSLEESRAIILDNMDEIKSLAEEVIKGEGKDYSVNISLGQDEFPVRRYGNMVFPQGEYETLIMEIGQGVGQNWWCVMFPPLCFVDITHSMALDIDGELGDYIIDETQPLKLKSKLAELLKKISASF